MINPRREAILIRTRQQNGLVDKTPEVAEYRTAGAYTYVTFGSEKRYRYSSDKVIILGNPAPVLLQPQDAVTIHGKVVEGVTELLRFESPQGTWWRAFHTVASGPGYQTCRDNEIAISRPSAEELKAQAILDYWREISSKLREDDPLRRQYENFNSVPQGSALDLYLRGQAQDSVRMAQEPPILPFSSNISQREALMKGLSNRISVIDGPPGTGKTQTILNLVANIVAAPGRTVGIVSFNNAAVENVRDKLAEEGFGYIVADLRRKEKMDEFFVGQKTRNADVDHFVSRAPGEAPTADKAADLDRRLRVLQETARNLARMRHELEAFKLERRHFLRQPERPGSLGPAGVASLPGSSSRILEFLAETSPVPVDEGPLRRFFRRIKLRLRYGQLGSVDSRATDVVLSLQRAYYDKKIAELEQGMDQAEAILADGDHRRLEEEHRLTSRQMLDASLHLRYARTRRRIYTESNYKTDFAEFTSDYPVVLSTCHSLRRNVPVGKFLDYLIIDEASQVDLLAAGLALSCARNVIVVGDLQQLQHIADEKASRHSSRAPSPNVDYTRHNILSSIIQQFGAYLPRTMLREHYRCDPAIIDYCNKKFYDGQLVPYTSGTVEGRPLVVVRTVAGNHMRQHHGGGRTNQREADVIAKEVLAQFCSGVPDHEIAVVTPYRRQVDKVTEALLNNIQADTVHKFQGRQKSVIIMSTVLDESNGGASGMEFVDDPHLVNVAVSRAVKRFVLVTNNAMLPTSRHLRDLIHFIQYRYPEDGVFDSSVLSVFDLLYKEYSALLRPLASRVRGNSQFASENIVWTLLSDIVQDKDFGDLAIAPQVMLRNLLPDLTMLTPEQLTYVQNRATLDFVVYNRISNRPVLAVEVDGYAFHENNPVQQARDAHKDAICREHKIRLLRLPTTGSGEEAKIRRELWAAVSGGNNMGAMDDN
ncbi:AAA domain-containing protein [Paenarthrobacter sp. NPDC057981]|uniref:AAA domain-containing protein n=1 Tax=Paenarthrobacter sp. NPDC057981 TaxID=3346297 RepID=UPI0036DD5D25